MKIVPITRPLNLSSSLRFSQAKRSDLPLWRGLRGRRHATGVGNTLSDGVQMRYGKFSALAVQVAHPLQGLSSPYTPSKGGHSASRKYKDETGLNRYSSIIVLLNAKPNP